MSTIQEKRRNLNTLLDELKGFEAKMSSGSLTETEGKAAHDKAQEAEALQKEIDEADALATKTRDLLTKANDRRDGSQMLPAGAKARDDMEEKDNGRFGEFRTDVDIKRAAGYVTLGEHFVASQAFEEYVKAGFPDTLGSRPVITPVLVKDRHGRFTPYVPLTREQCKTFEAKAVPSLGTGVIDPQRLADIVRVTEYDELTLLTVLAVSTTTSNMVEWIKYTKSAGTSGAAQAVADQSSKPEGDASATLVQTAVRTIAEWIPVTEQMLADAPRIISEVNDNLLFDLGKKVEKLVLYGSGAGQEFQGILTDANVLEGRAVVGDTLIDRIKRAATDVRKSNYSPNAAIFDPMDWEAVVLTKANTEQYIWVVVTEPNGASRIWGMRAVENQSMEDTNAERCVLIGDFRRGGTLWVREAASIRMGWINEQFIKNMRTILAEQRAAYATQRPLAFRKVTTNAAGAS